MKFFVENKNPERFRAKRGQIFKEWAGNTENQWEFRRRKHSYINKICGGGNKNGKFSETLEGF